VKRGKTLVVGSDHAGFKLKEYVKNRLEEMGYRVEDVGTYDENPVDYPDYAEKVALRVLRGRNRRGVLACGTGIGASIAANKIPGIRAALACNVEEARLSREHNDANLLVLGGWGYKKREVAEILRTWLRGRFRGGRHLRRVRKIARLEKKYRMRTPSGIRR
jgi:ribose 5-phosphate isomerase B